MTNQNLPYNKTIKPRNYGIDLLRIVCMLMIPVLHILGHGGVLSSVIPFSMRFECAWLLESFCFCAVNCFVLITGYVYFSKKTKFYRVFALWAEVLFYSIIIFLVLLWLIPNQVTIDQVWPSFLPSLSNSYWFFTSYLGMFIFTPFINEGLNKFSKKQDLIAILLIFVILSFLPTIFNQTVAFNIESGYSVLWFIVLYYIGGIIHKYELHNYLKNDKWLLVWIICCLMTLLLKNIVDLIYANNTSSPFLAYNSPLYLIGSVAFSCFFINLKIRNKFSISIINFFAPVCFGVYLIHDNYLIRQYFMKNAFAFLANFNALSMTLLIIGFALAIFISCSLIDWIRELIFEKLELKLRLANLEERINNRLDELLENKT